MTWDEAKRQENLRKHGFDLVGCDAAFDHPVVAWEDDREVYGEQRINVLGFLNGDLVHLTYTEPLRKAEKHEIKRYRAALAKDR